MKIDIDQLTEAELLELNHHVVARLRLLQQARALTQMADFKIGDRVAFQPPGQATVIGMLTRYNRKTVTVVTDEGRQWNVSPSMLNRVVPLQAAPSGGTDLLLPRKR
jgi:hypothetical protein